MAVGLPTTWRGLSQQKARWFCRDGEVRRSRHSFGLPEPGLESQGCQSSRRWVYGTQLLAATGGPPPSPFLSLSKSPPCFLQLSSPQNLQPDPAVSAFTQVSLPSPSPAVPGAVLLPAEPPPAQSRPLLTITASPSPSSLLLDPPMIVEGEANPALGAGENPGLVQLWEHV